MALAPTTYPLRSRGAPAEGVERPIRVRRVSAENEEIEDVQAQLAAVKAVIDAFQLVVNALTSTHKQRPPGRSRDVFRNQFQTIKAPVRRGSGAGDPDQRVQEQSL
jgi:hypothetical protein